MAKLRRFVILNSFVVKSINIQETLVCDLRKISCLTMMAYPDPPHPPRWTMVTLMSLGDILDGHPTPPWQVLVPLPTTETSKTATSSGVDVRIYVAVFAPHKFLILRKYT